MVFSFIWYGRWRFNKDRNNRTKENDRSAKLVKFNKRKKYV